MSTEIPLEDFAPPFATDTYSEQERYQVEPFFTNLTRSVYVPYGLSPEVIGALCSRTSRAAADLRKIFLQEYITPFLEATDDSEAAAYGQQLKEFIDFLHKHPIQDIFSNPKARSFYAKWLAQYGDDSIAQMAGMHLIYSGISQVAIKHFQDQRIGLAPIEKSTRYVDYSQKINGHYLYYTDPSLKELGLEEDYRAALDGLFDTYIDLLPKLQTWLQQQFPEEKPGVVEKKAFDTLRGLLPTAALSQVAFFGNGQAFEYMLARSLRHPLGEIRWGAEAAYEELYRIAPSFLRRLKDSTNLAAAADYQDYLANRNTRVSDIAAQSLRAVKSSSKATAGHHVDLVEYDPEGETKVLASIIYAADKTNASWNECLSAARQLSAKQADTLLNQYLAGRSQRWQKVGRAFENTFVRFDITMNIGAWRDLHRHRMHTQQRQLFTCALGYDTPPELLAARLATPYQQAIERVAAMYARIAHHDPYLAQYAVTLAHKVRFQQYQNLRQAFWEIELRTIPEGHPDYRVVEQEKFKLIEKVYPRIAQHMRVNLGQYDFARRGQEEKIQAKLKALENLPTI